MLNGVYPVIVFQKINATGKPGTPIPIYLDEQLTGIAIISQSRKTDFSNDTIVDSKTGKVEVKQRGLINGIDIVLKANRNSIGINIILPLINLAFQNANLGLYQVSYFNKNAILFRAKIISFSTEENNSNDGVIINMFLAQEDKSEENNKVAVKKTEGSPGNPHLFDKN